MTCTRTAALGALAAASWLAACTGRSPALRSSSPSTPARESATYDVASSEADGSAAEVVTERPGLGTEFGENVASHVVDQPFERAQAEPFALVAIHYNDEDGVRAQALTRGGTLGPLTTSTPEGGISIALTDEYGNPLPGAAAPGRIYVVGRVGQRYNIQIANHTAGRYELVASVDGLDVIDGTAASYGKRGYIVPPSGTLTIDGFRTSDDTVAAFRFGAVRDSYAARTGNDRNVGVVGFAFFAERGSQWTSDEIDRRETADPFPDRYAVPPP
jgi:hypothetical protein